MSQNWPNITNTVIDSVFSNQEDNTTDSEHVPLLNETHDETHDVINPLSEQSVLIDDETKSKDCENTNTETIIIDKPLETNHDLIGLNIMEEHVPSTDNETNLEKDVPDLSPDNADLVNIVHVERTCIQTHVIDGTSDEQHLSEQDIALQQVENIIEMSHLRHIDRLKIKYPDVNMDNIFSDFTDPQYNSLQYVHELDKVLLKTYEPSNILDREMKELHLKLQKTRLFKILNMAESHNHFYYSQGLQIYQDKFDMNSNCGYGGLYCATEIDISAWASYAETVGVFIREVFLLPDSLVLEMDCKIKTNKFILGKRMMVEEIVDHHLVDQIIENFKDQEKNDMFQLMYGPFQTIQFVPEDYKHIDAVYSICLTKFKPQDIYRICKMLKNPSDNVKWTILHLNHTCITTFSTYTSEMYDFVFAANPKIARKLKVNDHAYETIYNSIMDDLQIYNIMYLTNVANENAEAFLTISPYTALIMTGVSDKIVDTYASNPHLLPYYEMHKLSPDRYIINDESIVERLKKQLLVFFNEKECEMFMRNLFMFEGILSGSFVSNCVYDTSHSFGDIDIYFNNYAEAMNFGNSLKFSAYLRTSIVTYNAYSILGANIERIITHKVLKPETKMPIIQLIVIKPKLDIINYIMTYYDIDYCKVGISGNYTCYKYGSDNGISEHIFNVFRMINDIIELYKSKMEKPATNKYFMTLLNSVKHYIKKVNSRIDKYVNRGVYIDPNSIQQFRELQAVSKRFIEFAKDTTSDCLAEIADRIAQTTYNMMNNIEELPKSIAEKTQPMISTCIIDMDNIDDTNEIVEVKETLNEIVEESNNTGIQLSDIEKTEDENYTACHMTEVEPTTDLYATGLRQRNTKSNDT
jgi:hypothetical protein